MIDEFINNEEFNCLTQTQKEGIKNLAANCNGKNASEMAPFIMKFLKDNDNFKNIDEKSKKAMVNLVFSTLPENQRKMFSVFINS